MIRYINYTALILLFALTFQTAEAKRKDKSLKHYLKEIKSNNNCESISVPWLFIRLSAYFVKDAPVKEALRSLDKISVISSEEKRAIDVSDLCKFLDKNYLTLMSVKESNQLVRVYGKTKRDKLRELLLIVSGEDNAIIQLKGEISPKSISKIVNHCNKKE